jgi:hypothetical protein
MVSPLLLESSFLFFSNYSTRFLDPDSSLYSPQCVALSSSAFSLHGENYAG